VKAFVALALLAFIPCRADDLVFPQGAYIKLSSADKKAYARLDFALGLCPRVYPDKIVAADKSSWEVPVPQFKVRWRYGFPTIYVPAGEYVLLLRSAQLRWGCGCANTELNLGNGKCIASCTSYAVLEPEEMTLPWKAEAGEHYETTTTLSVGAPMPVVQWGGGGGRCPYSVSPALPGGGIATICVKKTKGGGQPAIDSTCRDTHYSLEVTMPKTGSGRGGPPTATVGPGEQPK
jgi:hypothetical protein